MQEHIKQNKKKYLNQKTVFTREMRTLSTMSKANRQWQVVERSKGLGGQIFARNTNARNREHTGLVMVGNMLKCKCQVCGPNVTHAGSKHNAWKTGNYTIPAHHPLFTYNTELGNTVPEQGSSLWLLLLLLELLSKGFLSHL